MPYKEMQCPECKEIWKGNIPESRVKLFYERCQHCNKVVEFKEVEIAEQVQPYIANVEIAGSRPAFHTSKKRVL